MITKDTKLPTVEELTVEECNLSQPSLRAGAFFLGKYCEDINNEFMLCRKEERDPRKCLNEGKAVTSCTLNFFRLVKKNCMEEFMDYADCLDRSSDDLRFSKCRKTQAIFDTCMKEKLNMDRPHLGYFCEARVHSTNRPKPPRQEPKVYPDALPEIPPDSIPRNNPRHDTRSWFS